MFAHQHCGVTPDLLTLAKGIASGYMPLAATVAKRKVFEAFLGEVGGLEHFRHVNTYGGHPVACAVALRNIEILEREGLVERAGEVGRALLAKLQPLARHPNVGDIRGKGLLIGIELVEDVESRRPLATSRLAAVAAACARNGVMVGRTTNTTPELSNVLILAPPFTLADDEAELLVSTLEAALYDELPTAAAARATG